MAKLTTLELPFEAADVLEILHSQMGADPGGETPEQFADFVKKEHLKWKALIAEIGIKPE